MNVMSTFLFFFLMTFIDTDTESTYIDSTKHGKKIKGQKGEDEEEAT